MKLTRSIGYAISALEYIYKKHPKSIAAREIAAKYKIPVEYLQKVLQHLVRNGILDAIRGPQGGFSLARPANRINLYDIFEAVEGGLSVEAGQFPCNAAKTTINETVRCYASAQDQTRKVFRKTTLVDLVGQKSGGTSRKKTS